MGTGAPKYYFNGTMLDFPAVLSCDQSRRLVSSSRSPFPQDAVWLQPAVYALACPVKCAWFSHLWLDNVFPHFWAAQVVGAYDPRDFGIVWRSLIPLRHPCRCEPFFRRWVWPSGLVHPNSSCQLPLTTKPICFRNVIIGGTAFAYDTAPPNAFSGLAPAFRALRDFVRYGIAGLTPEDGPQQQRVLVIRKQGKRRVLNTAELVAHLQVCFPGVPVAEGTMDVSPLAQLQALNAATVVIAPSGTVAYSVLFAPKHTVLIQVDRFVPSTNTSHGADQYVFMNAGVHFMAYSLRQSETRMEYGKKAQWARRADPDWQHLSFASVMVDTLRMAHLVYWALRKAQDARGGDPNFRFPRTTIASDACTTFGARHT
eukprot:EG_transcript_12546